LLLALASTLSTAFAHAFLKAGKNKLAVQAWVRLMEFAVALPLAVLIGLPPHQLVPWLIAAGAIHAVYQLTLTWSYSVSDFSVAYPLARGATPLFTTIAGVVLLGDRPGWLMLSGVVLVTAGILLLLRRQGISRHGVVAATAAALLTTCYSIVDAHGVRLAPRAIVFVTWFFMADSLSMPIALLVREGKSAGRALAGDWRIGIAAGLLALCAFAPALFAFDLAPVGAVSALRECSILIGLALGGTMLKERLNRNRVIGAVSIFAGGLAIIGQSL
jgi:drug/metabolite transporter (DMT)-like permease